MLAWPPPLSQATGPPRSGASTCPSPPARLRARCPCSRKEPALACPPLSSQAPGPRASTALSLSTHFPPNATAPPQRHRRPERAAAPAPSRRLRPPSPSSPPLPRDPQRPPSLQSSRKAPRRASPRLPAEGLLLPSQLHHLLPECRLPLPSPPSGLRAALLLALSKLSRPGAPPGVPAGSRTSPYPRPRFPKISRFSSPRAPSRARPASFPPDPPFLPDPAPLPDPGDPRAQGRSQGPFPSVFRPC